MGEYLENGVLDEIPVEVTWDNNQSFDIPIVDAPYSVNVWWFRAPEFLLFGALECIPCKYSGCLNLVDVGLPYCSVHTEEKWGLVIGASEIEGAGLGVYATRRIDADSWICPYHGYSLSASRLDRMYGDYTAPYAFMMRWSGRIMNGDIVRGIGTVINHDHQYANVIFRQRGENEGGALWARATNDIEAGEELYADYVTEESHSDSDSPTYQLHEEGVEYGTEFIDSILFQQCASMEGIEEIHLGNNRKMYRI